ncbi:IS66 family insertion sequence element accessory protein TnpB [Brevibacillus sp. WF146]|uniref:IS66 family insertion sequence element accessory protein TnpB n=1 Tax=Brevibacillus sp. WF146 TaxID=319501 RepID=UPI000A00B209|nr:IS66 family insertion sequence element accessory protein TnpB [Brevibacillus sp. WF146]UYZ11561.1 IS66 family insertion sequence element accessory protein TnpB [Brevibacillus sp. WF146]
MLTLSGAQRVYLACGSTDLRKSIDGLAALVQQGFGLDPFSPYLFVFCNRARNKLKILYWDHNGFWLFYRRLERGRFQWPTGKEGTVTVSSRELRWLLDGLALSQRQAESPSRNRDLATIVFLVSSYLPTGLADVLSNI